MVVMDELKFFLDQHPAPKVEETGKSIFTHVSLGKFSSGSYRIPLEKNLTLNSLLSNSRAATLAEKPQGYFPLRVDIDFKFRGNKDDTFCRVYTHDLIKSIVLAYQKVSKYCFLSRPNLECFLLEKKAPRFDSAKNCWKDGFHLHFPNIVVDIDQYDLIFKEANELILKTPYIKSWIASNSSLLKNEFKDCFDNISRNCWLMYGCSKDLESEPYLYTEYFDGCGNLEKKKLNKSTLIDLFSIRNRHTKLEFNEGYLEKLDSFTTKQFDGEKPKFDEDYIDRNLQIVKHYAPLFETEEASDNTDTWRYYGNILHSLTNGHEEAFVIWDLFSQLSSKYIEGEPKKLWDRWTHISSRTNGRKLTIGHLKGLAKKLNKDEYSFLRAEEGEQDARNIKDLYSGERGHARIIRRKLGNNLKFVNKKQGYWWQDKKKLWIQIVHDNLLNYVSSTLDDLIFKEYARLRGLTDDKSLGKKKILDKVNVDRNTYRHNSNIIKYLKTDLTLIDKTFNSKINTPHHLLPIRNGKAIDCQTGKVIVRTKEHYFFNECPINEIGDANDKTIQRLFKNICGGNKNKVRYLASEIAYLLAGENPLRLLMIWKGIGKNGKTTIMNLIEMLLGEMYGECPKELIIKTKTNGHQAHYIKLRYKRVVCCKELEPEDILNVSEIKVFTGEKSTNIRDAHQAGEDAEVLHIGFTPVVMTNKFPKFNTNDQAIIDRLNYMHFGSKFTENPEKENEYKIEYDIESKINLDNLIAFLLRFSKKNYKSGSKKIYYYSDEFQKEQDDFINESNPVYMFLDEETVDAPNKLSIKTCGQIYRDYKYWCNETKYTPLKLAEFKNEVSKKYPIKECRSRYKYFLGLKMIGEK